MNVKCIRPSKATSAGEQLEPILVCSLPLASFLLWAKEFTKDHLFHPSTLAAAKKLNLSVYHLHYLILL